MLFKVTRLCLKSVKPIVGRTAKFAGISMITKIDKSNKATKVDKSNNAKKIVPNIANIIPTVITEVEEKPVKISNAKAQDVTRNGQDPLEVYMGILFTIILTIFVIMLCSIFVSEIIRLYRMH